MATTLYWLQCGACGGDSMGLLGAQDPNITEMEMQLDLNVLWHPSLSNGSAAAHRKLLDELMAGDRPLDVLCVEGSVVRGPGGTGMFDTFDGRPKKDLVARLALQAKFVIAMGTCACFGGIPGQGETGATGLQYHGGELGGFLGEYYRSRGGLPVINLPGCPVLPEVVKGLLVSLVCGDPLELNEWHAPEDFYGMLVHQGCTRNEYHEFRVEENDFGQKGCLFFHLGCMGPYTYGPCNKYLTAGRTSGTRVGIPCVGCMRPDFPRSHPFFRTRELEGVPLDLPLGVDRAHFLAYKTMARAAAPERLKERKTAI